MKDNRFWRIVALGLFLAGIGGLAHLHGVSEANAASSSIPAQTYGRMTIPAAAADGGGAVQVPTNCMSPRGSVLLYNLDTAFVCCGADNQVTCSGAHGGFPIAPAIGGVPGTFSLPLNCDGTKGNVFCWSDAGTISSGFGWQEVR